MPLAGSWFSKGLAQLVSTRGGTTVVSRPPIKKSTREMATAQRALVSAFLNMIALLSAA